MHFGSLVRKLRGERGMSQERLAVAAGLSAATVNRLERSESGPHRSTATAILVALEGGGRTRLTEEERAAFLHASGLEHLVASLQGSFDVIPLRAFTAGLSPDAARVYWAVADLMEKTGPAALLQMLQGVAAMAGVTLEAPVPGDAEPQELSTPRHLPSPPTLHRVVKPPVQREGYVEQEIVEYGPADAPPAEKEEPASPKKKRRSS